MTGFGSRVFSVSGRRLAAAAIVVGLFGNVAVAAENYPSQPIKLIVGYPPGGSNDIVARIIAQPLATELGGTVIVENRAGANGTIAVNAVAKSRPDGHTLLLSSASPVVIAPHIMEKVPFDTVKDLVPINSVGHTPETIAVRSQMPVNSLAELIALSRKKSISLASAGAGGLPHLTIELLKDVSKGDFLHVPFKGAAPAVTDTLAGHVDGVVMDLPPLYPFIKEGKLRALAVTSENRVNFLNNVPTAREELPGFAVINWLGVFAPANMPKEVTDRINAALIRIVARPEIREQFVRVAVIPSTMESPAAFKAFVGTEYTRWGKVAKDAGITMTN